MRRLRRETLSPAALEALARLTARVQADPDPPARVQTLWRAKSQGATRPVFEEIRATLHTMAPGLARCMYCEESHGTDIEHFWPKGTYPSRAFDWSNYLLACSHCNSNLKRDEFPLDGDGAPLLIDPTVDEPAAHLRFTPTTGEFNPLDPKGVESIRVFGLNDRGARNLPRGRVHALTSLVVMLEAYASAVTQDAARAAGIREAVCDHPFSAVLHWLVRIAASDAGAEVLGPDVVALLAAHQVATWL